MTSYPAPRPAASRLLDRSDPLPVGATPAHVEHLRNLWLEGLRERCLSGDFQAVADYVRILVWPGDTRIPPAEIPVSIEAVWSDAYRTAWARGERNGLLRAAQLLEAEALKGARKSRVLLQAAEQVRALEPAERDAL